VSGKAAIGDALGPMMQDPNFSLSFEANAVDVARSGDLAYETGAYSMSLTDPATRRVVTEKGNYIVVWKKQADGSWKVVRDVPVSDGPAASQ
jgi:ketosteroid isomerase-like protein